MFTMLFESSCWNSRLTLGLSIITSCNPTCSENTRKDVDEGIDAATVIFSEELTDIVKNIKKEKKKKNGRCFRQPSPVVLLINSLICFISYCLFSFCNYNLVVQCSIDIWILYTYKYVISISPLYSALMF